MLGQIFQQRVGLAAAFFTLLAIPAIGGPVAFGQQTASRPSEIPAAGRKLALASPMPYRTGQKATLRPGQAASFTLPPGSAVQKPEVNKASPAILPAAAALFNVPLTYPSGPSTVGAATGDFNGDGIADVVVANYFNEVSVLLGNTDGSFQLPVFYSVAGSTSTTGDSEVAVGDFNGDGKLDIIVADPCPSGGGGICITSSGALVDGMVSILLGNGDGSFQPAVTFDAGASAYSVIVGDFNGDGKLDAAVVNANVPPAISILLGKGDGTFQAPVSYTIPSGQLANYLAVGDLNHDGKLDLVVDVAYTGSSAISNGGVVVLLGKGDGTFPSQVTYATGIGTIKPVIADFNGDGKLDLAVINSGVYQTENPPLPVPPGSVSILLGNGDGTFQNQVQYPTGYSTWEPAAVDFNGDGKLDLVVSNFGDSTVGILLGNGDGTFLPQSVVGAAATPWTILAGEFTGGTLSDLLTSEGASVAVYRNNGKSSVSSYVINGGAGNGPGAGAGFPAGIAADFNGDGKLDVAVADGAGSYGAGAIPLPAGGGVTVMLGKGDGTFPSTDFYPILSSDGAITVGSGDFRGNGILDLVVGGQYFGTYIMLGNGDGTFQDYQQLPGNGTATVAVGDFNNDGKLDFVIGDYDQYDNQDNQILLGLYLGNGDGTFQGLSPIITAATGSNSFYGIATGDFNNDGNLDIAVTNANGSGANLFVLLGNGHGGFKAPVVYPSTGAGAIATGDVNGDGKLDLILSGSASGTGAAGIFLGNGDGTFQPEADYSTPAYSAPEGLRLADLNGDGKLDIALSDSENVGILLGNGDGSFQPSVDFVAGASADVIAADLNGDGAIDVGAVAPFYGFEEAGNVNVLLNTMGRIIQPAATSTTLTVTPNPAAAGGNVVFVTTVTAAGGATAGTVTFKAGPEVLGKCTLVADGYGRCTYAASSTGIAPGTYVVTATFSGNSTYLGSTSPPVSVVVAHASNIATATTLTATPNPATAGSSIALTATVSAASGTATGTVRFEYGGDVLGSCTLTSGSCTYSASSKGIAPSNYPVTATYIASGNYLASTSTAVTIVLDSATATTLAVAPNPIAEGNSVALTASVTATQGTAGTVEFTYGSDVLGSCTLLNGNCTLTASSKGIPPGTYGITAHYKGNNNYLPSTSLSVSVVVTAGSNTFPADALTGSSDDKGSF